MRAPPGCRHTDSGSRLKARAKALAGVRPGDQPDNSPMPAGMPDRVSDSQARGFLVGKYGAVEDLRPLEGGFWSSTYSFSLAGRELVVRFGARRDWFGADRAAMAFASSGLPVPEVLEIGDAFGGAYAISVRHHGVNLEDVQPQQAAVAGPMLASLLAALFEVPKSADLPVGWHWQPPRSDLTWRGWLAEQLVDDPSRQVHGWRATLAADSEIDRVFRAGEGRVRELIEACPERRDLIHGDLLHANVLVSEDGSRPTAVFSWKCSLRGDFLYDTAWCTFCGDVWFPGIAAADPRARVRQEPAIRAETDAWDDASERHHCYELHIALTAIAWQAWVNNHDTLRRIASQLEVLLERGPLPADT